MVLLGYSGARGTLIYEKDLKSKISCQTPFKIPGSYWLLVTGARFYNALDSCMQRSDHLETELASHWLFFKIPGSYWLLVTGAHCYYTLDSCMQQSDHLETELASHRIGCFLRPTGSYWLLFTGARFYTALDSCMQRSDHLETELASHWLFFLRYQALIG
jgi:hypothetical protein